jgi:hypothetical protein
VLAKHNLADKINDQNACGLANSKLADEFNNHGFLKTRNMVDETNDQRELVHTELDGAINDQGGLQKQKLADNTFDQGGSLKDNWLRKRMIKEAG